MPAAHQTWIAASLLFQPSPTNPRLQGSPTSLPPPLPQRLGQSVTNKKLSSRIQEPQSHARSTLPALPKPEQNPKRFRTKPRTLKLSPRNGISTQLSPTHSNRASFLEAPRNAPQRQRLNSIFWNSSNRRHLHRRKEYLKATDDPRGRVPLFPRIREIRAYNRQESGSKILKKERSKQTRNTEKNQSRRT